MTNRPEYIIIWLGMMKINVITSLINTDLVGKSLNHVINTSESKIIIMGSELIKNYVNSKIETKTEKLYVCGEIFEKLNKEVFEEMNEIKFDQLDKDLLDKQDSFVDLKYRKNASVLSKAFFIFTSGN
jgi:long-subunit acyl-CoA synthetase (AMP-forming)